MQTTYKRWSICALKMIAAVALESKFVRLLATGLSVLLCTTTFGQGKIVVANDEWGLSNTGFSLAPEAAQFALNLANWFASGTLGNFLAYTTNFGLTGSSLTATMTGAGRSWTVSTPGTVDLSLM